jgi:phosphoenolpyruvate synthase/pyruvate phosphate dikinase
VADGHLADEDLVFFFRHKELLAFVADPSPKFAQKALQRRRALHYQNRLSMPLISVGKPEPIEPEPVSMDENTLVGRPVSSGRVTAPCRVAHTPEEAASLQPGEILIAPITDIGWTPYFSLIAGLATDVGSSVSHGAVIAREYGLPAVVNLRVGTKRFQTGDIVCLDGDLGELSWVEPPSE